MLCGRPAWAISARALLFAGLLAALKGTVGCRSIKSALVTTGFPLLG
ncbi:hypothetical protein TevJSym_bg00110 [endosymbiont of Tevnia jerichonana (vent Tica)]|uniref:Uncharacterized protein n=1 Tax=endosymbiont of Tevnia jerichonana (vent Tica) TaxID=1049564 RepID=G2FIU0_9GAMM|nr:hypothetical protein TevJSym_bg00110 [endosymbiont of Tevnia jerichonana (vent Tica)]